MQRKTGTKKATCYQGKKDGEILLVTSACRRRHIL